MNSIHKWIVFLLAFSILITGLPYTASADHDEPKERRHYRRKNQNHSENYSNCYLRPVNNATYKENCCACHFAYQPELLPSGSWKKILLALGDNFGEAVELDSDAKKVIDEYLSSNAAEHSSAKGAVKIMKCLGSTLHMRITQIPYIQKKHHEINQEVFKRKAIGSLSNCSACHTTAEKGVYEDDTVVIPK